MLPLYHMKAMIALGNPSS